MGFIFKPVWHSFIQNSFISEVKAAGARKPSFTQFLVHFSTIKQVHPIVSRFR
jgi:hypothetical protein